MRTFIKSKLACAVIIAGLIILNGCKKDDEVKTDADNLTGTWSVSETVSGSTTTYSSTITKKSSNVIMISSERTNPPAYYMNNLEVTVKWAEKKIEKTGTSFSGTVASENDFEIHFTYGTSGTVYSVSQHYTR